MTQVLIDREVVERAIAHLEAAFGTPLKDAPEAVALRASLDSAPEGEPQPCSHCGGTGEIRSWELTPAGRSISVVDACSACKPQPKPVHVGSSGLVGPNADAQLPTDPITDDEQTALYAFTKGTPHYSAVRRLYSLAHAYVNAAPQPHPIPEPGADKGAARDAARYRWLREKRDIPGPWKAGPYPSIPWPVRAVLEHLPTVAPCWGVELDAAIDAAMAALSQPAPPSGNLAVDSVGAMEGALLPCPFCGSEPNEQNHPGFGWRIFCDDGPDHAVFMGGWGCCKGESTREEAIAAWNRRAPSVVSQQASAPESAGQAGGAEWKEAVWDACVNAGLDGFSATADPRATLRELLDWTVRVALDSAVSEVQEVHDEVMELVDAARIASYDEGVEDTWNEAVGRGTDMQPFYDKSGETRAALSTRLRALLAQVPAQPSGQPERPASLSVVLNMLRETKGGNETRIPTPACWDLARYIEQLEGSPS